MENEQAYRDIVIEVFDVFIQNMLFIRGLYPPKIFKEVNAFNAPVHVSMYPPLTSYISNVLYNAKQLIYTNNLQKMQLIFYKADGIIIECYDFCLYERECEVTDDVLNKKCIIYFEEEIRKSLLQTTSKLKSLEILPKGSTFKILLHTTQSAFIAMNKNPDNQKFHWVQESLRPEIINKLMILPITAISSYGLQITTMLY